MLRDALIFSAIAILGAIYFAGGDLDYLRSFSTRPETVAVVDAKPSQPTARNVRIRGDRSGHFVANFSLNGTSVKAVVDTGASAIAINRSTARRLGISVAPSDFTYAVSTANGQTYAATVVLDRVEIGNIRIRDVPAVVLEDSALSMTLIGMTFLKQTRFSVADNVLQLTQ